MADYKALDQKLIRICKRTAEMCTAAGSGHPSSGLSLAHLTVALMYQVMRYDPKNPWNTAADRLVLSEGHAVPVIYAAYCDLGGVGGTQDSPKELTFDDALTLRENDSILDGHPNPAQGMPFFDAATGSLGMGPSVAAGLALAARLDKCDKAIYCIVGDGESREGQVWEAIDFIVDHKLTAVRLIFNCNGQGQSDYVSSQQSVEALQAKLAASNVDVKVIDGHNWDEVLAALQAQPADKPIAIVAKTVKGWGSTELASKNYHGKPLNENLLEQTIADFDILASQMDVADDSDEYFFAGEVPTPYDRPCCCGIEAGDISEAFKAAGLDKALEDKKLATRRAFGVALQALGAKNDCIVALDGDVRGSTFTNMFADACPDRYFEGRIAEQNLISAAAGLGAGGKVPFATSFAKFLVRGYDQIEMASISHANVKLCGSHAGVSLAADGPSQMGLPDLAFMRSFAHCRRIDGQPAMRVFCPSDAVSAFKLTEQMAQAKGMCYMRTHRPDVPFLYDLNEEFPFGGFKQLAQGKDLCIIASGYMVHMAKEALAALEKAGVSACLYDVYSMPLLQVDDLLDKVAGCCGKILVVEDNFVGGFCDEINRAVALSGKGIQVRNMFVEVVPKSAKSPADILKQVELTPDNIAAAAQKMLSR